MKTLVAVTVAMIMFVAVVIANEVAGTYETVGEPYTASFTYCAQYTGVGGTRHCSLYLTGTERRVNTRVHGYFFDTDSYKVVDR